MPYFILNGAEKFIQFTQSVFGARETARHLHPDGSIMHAEVTIGGMVIMVGNSTKDWSDMTGSIFIYVEDADIAFQAAVRAGATVVLDLENKEYGRSGGVKDPTGVTWWITSL